MARTDSLGNFLTDVAAAIKTKTGKVASITPANFDTEINSIAVGEPIQEDLSAELTAQDTIISSQETKIEDIIEALSKKAKPEESEENIITVISDLYIPIIAAVEAQLKGMVNKYPVYTEDSITLYTPSANATHYVIRYRSSGYGIVWFTTNVLAHVGGYIRPAVLNIGSFSVDMTISTPSISVSQLSRTGYMSPNYATFEECVAAIQDPTTEYTTSTSLDWTIADDGEYNISATNMPLANADDIKTRKLSSDETIEIISTE